MGLLFTPNVCEKNYKFLSSTKKVAQERKIFFLPHTVCMYVCSERVVRFAVR